MQDWQTWFKNLIAKNYFFTKLTNPDEVSSPIVKAIKEKEVTPQIDPSDISQPIVGAIDDLRKSVEEKEGIEEVTVKNIEQAKADFTEVVAVLKDILNKEEKDIEFPEQKETVINLIPVIEALGKIEKAIPDYKPQQIADYTEILQNLTKVIESKQPADLSKIESQLETAFAPLAKTEDMVALAAWLEAIATKPESEEPPFEFEKGRLKVQVDRIGGGGSGLTSTESSALQGVSTAAKQDAIITKLSNTGIQASDSPSIDAFSRWRVSEPQTIFDAQLTYGLAPLLYEPITAEANATITHDATNRCALMTFAATPTGGKAYMQTYEHFRYQPGKSQLVFVTFNMIEGVANTLKFAGYSDGANGIEFQLNGTTKQITLYSDTGHGDESVPQASWNLDKLDGTGASGLLLDITKVQIFVIDFQALYVGRVRVGFDIGGSIIYVHEFNHANIDANPYIQTANLPIRVGMTSSGTVSTTMNFICCSVLSEGGQDETQGYLFSQEGTVTAGNGTDTHILSIQPSTTFNSIANRYKFILESVDITVTGTRPVLWKLCIGQALSGTTTMIDVNGTYSATQYNILGTLSGSPAIIVAQGYAAASATTKTATSTRVPMKYPITLDAAGVARVNGRLTVIVNGIGGTSETRCILNWREIR